MFENTKGFLLGKSKKPLTPEEKEELAVQGPGTVIVSKNHINFVIVVPKEEKA